MNYRIYLLLVAAIIISGCRKPYLPPIISSGTNYLVVEGAINTGQDSTIIHLSRTVPLSSPSGTMPPSELNASVVVESDASASYPLTAAGNGYYVAVGLNLNASNKYRVQITTADGKVYQSDFVTAKNSPPIDSLNYKLMSNGVQINVNTHDAADNTLYYRWDYNETWIIHAKYKSNLVLQTQPKDTIVYRFPEQQIYRCWSSGRSTNIVLGSTAKLAKDILVNSPITNIPSTSEKFTERYSILVKQYALTKEAFEYYQQLQKNTEQLGTIFDAQPSTLTGNIHCKTNPSEQVIGYITAGSVQQKRIYISSYDLPAGPAWFTNTPYGDCVADTFLFVRNHKGETLPVNEVARYLYTGAYIPIDALANPGQPPSGYIASSGICVDCTLRGTNKQPAFWTDK